MKCIYCTSSHVKKVSKEEFSCRDCGSSFDENDVSMETGKKSKHKVKFTGRRQ